MTEVSTTKTGSISKSILLQMIMQRLQKERDNFQEETEKLHERIEFLQNQIAKMQRDKENVLSELELVKERWEKAHNSHQKLTVSNLIFVVGHQGQLMSGEKERERERAAKLHKIVFNYKVVSRYKIV